MSDHTETLEHVGGTTQSFIYVWVALLVMTGIEVFMAYEQVPTLIMLTALVGVPKSEDFGMEFPSPIAVTPRSIYSDCLLYLFAPGARRFGP